MGYREYQPPKGLRELLECRWARDGIADRGWVRPDGCMDLIVTERAVTVAGPDTEAFTIEGGSSSQGLRFRPGILPRLLGVPAVEVRNRRVALADLGMHTMPRGAPLAELASALAARPSSRETAPWSTAQLHHVTRALATGAAVSTVADDLGWSGRTFHRQCLAVYGYGPATLRRVLRFRRAVRLLTAGSRPGDVAAETGYADQPHLHREVRALAGMPLSHVASGANTSMVVPSGSVTVA